MNQAANNQMLPTRPMLPPQPGHRNARWPHLLPMPGGRSGTLRETRHACRGKPSASLQRVRSFSVDGSNQ